jgi:trimethyllysine dioxygenase
LERIAFIRNTHYGEVQRAFQPCSQVLTIKGAFWDFTADLSSGDTAYTQLGIGPHTDNTYFSDPAGLQMFHLLHHTHGSGGASQLVDGFGAAKELNAKHPDAYEILSTVRVHAHASGGKDISIQPYQAFPTLVHDPHGGFLVQVRWNTTDRAAVDLPIEEMGAWYNAAGKWAKLLRAREYWEQLQPGRPLSKQSH